MPLGWRLVAWREWRLLWRRPVLLMLTVVYPLILMLLLMLVFQAGVPRQLPVAVLDQDVSELSRQLVRAVEATPEIALTVAVHDLQQGRALIQSGAVRGVLYLPQHLERDVLAGHRPEVVLFYDNQWMSTGGIIARGAMQAVTEVTTQMRVALRMAQGESMAHAVMAAQPVQVQASPLFNPALNYVHFLLAALLPAVLQIFIAATTAYSIGLDVQTRYRLRVMRRLGAGVWPAVLGKLLPYTVVFLLVLALVDGILLGLLGVPVRGSLTLLLVAAVGFVLASQLLGALMVLLVRNTGTALSLVAVLLAPAFGFMGIGFPREGMNLFAQVWGDLIPGTWFMQIRVDQTVRGAPWEVTLGPLLGLWLMVALLLGAVVIRLIIWQRPWLQARKAVRSNAALSATDDREPNQC